MPTEWFTRQQAADYLGVNVRTIDSYLRSGKLAMYRLSDFHVRLDAAQVRAYAQPEPVRINPHDPKNGGDPKVRIQ